MAFANKNSSISWVDTIEYVNPPIMKDEPIITVLQKDDLIKITPREFSKYLGCIIKFEMTRNPYDGIRREPGYHPLMRQDFIPKQELYYLIFRQHDNYIYFLKLHETETTRENRYWFLRLNTAGIVSTETEINRFDVSKVLIFNHITNDMFVLLEAGQIEKITKIRRNLLEDLLRQNTRVSKYILPKEILELVVANLSIPIHKVIEEPFSQYSNITPTTSKSSIQQSQDEKELEEVEDAIATEIEDS